MRQAALVAALVLAVSIGTGSAEGAEPVTQTFQAPVEKVWATAVAVLKHLGWDIDKEDRTIGWITTESRRVEGEDYGVYAKGTRHRLTLHVKALDTGRTTVSVERTVFKRERILWIDRDEPMQVTDRDVERALLAAIGKSL